MAKIVKFGQDPQIKAFAIQDDDKTSHGEWHNIFESAPVVTPGDSLVVEWNEMYSVGSGSIHEAMYAGLSGRPLTTFCVRGLNVMGMLTGEEALGGRFFVAQPILEKCPELWASAVIVNRPRLLIGISRYFVWHRMRREMVGLKTSTRWNKSELRDRPTTSTMIWAHGSPKFPC